MNKESIIKKLSMKKHIEGGYFCETHRSDIIINTNRQNNERPISTSIYYMLTEDSPIGYFHKNESDIIHYFHAGSTLTYIIIEPNGELKKMKLGPDIFSDDLLQLVVKGGCWKATILEKGEYGLLGEAVAPGFDYKDMEVGTKEKMRSLFPHLWKDIFQWVKPEA